MDTQSEPIKICLTFVRHGRSEGNEGGLIQGQKNTPLSDDGKAQAELAGVALSQVAFDKIYSSDLERAYDTASLIALQNKVSSNISSSENHNNVEINELLRERCFGIFELCPYKELTAAAESAGFKKDVNLYEFVPEGGEGLPDVRKRAQKFLDFVFKTVAEKNISATKTYTVLIASHSGLLRQISTIFFKELNCQRPLTVSCSNGEDLDKFLEKAIKNTAISTYEVQVDSATKEVLSAECTKYGCVDHLQTEV